MEMKREGEDGLVGLQRSVKRLHFGSWEEKEVAAEEIRGFAKDDLKMRKLLAELGVVPPLVAMVASKVGCRTRRRAAVLALVELANGSHTNKTLIIEAGLLSKLPRNISDSDESTRHELAKLLLSISSLAINSQFPLPSGEILSLLLGILESNSSLETKNFCLGALYNLSTMLENAATLATSGLVHHLLWLSTAKETSEKALATLGNLAVTLPGKKSIENSPLMVPERLIEVLSWEEKSKCQELSLYILMILAYRSSIQREKMADSGIVPLLLEVALLGTPLAQKRALKLLQWFKGERRVEMGTHSGPQVGKMIDVGSPMSARREADDDDDDDEGKKMMKKLVKQSLYKNMEKITRRANAAADQDDSCKLIKAFVIASSSKSLPY